MAMINWNATGLQYTVVLMRKCLFTFVCKYHMIVTPGVFYGWMCRRPTMTQKSLHGITSSVWKRLKVMVLLAILSLRCYLLHGRHTQAIVFWSWYWKWDIGLLATIPTWCRDKLPLCKICFQPGIYTYTPPHYLELWDSLLTYRELRHSGPF